MPVAATVSMSVLRRLTRFPVSDEFLLGELYSPGVIEDGGIQGRMGCISCRQCLQILTAKRSKFENFAQFTSSFMTSMFHGRCGLSYILGRRPVCPDSWRRHWIDFSMVSYSKKPLDDAKISSFIGFLIRSGIGCFYVITSPRPNNTGMHTLKV